MAKLKIINPQNKKQIDTEVADPDVEYIVTQNESQGYIVMDADQSGMVRSLSWPRHSNQHTDGRSNALVQD